VSLESFCRKSGGRGYHLAVSESLLTYPDGVLNSGAALFFDLEITMSENPAVPLDASNGEPTRAENLLAALSEKLAASANARSVYGDPVDVHGRTVIPVAKIGYGVGAGSGGRDGEKYGGGGGGGGVGGLPVGYIEITDQGSRYVEFSMSKRLTAGIFAGAVIGYLIGRLSR
jgi:uncharacterized spore protein YtfJ